MYHTELSNLEIAFFDTALGVEPRLLQGTSQQDLQSVSFVIMEPGVAPLNIGSQQEHTGNTYITWENQQV
jgi:hypothetical protein